MEQQTTYQHIIEKLNNGIPFGLFEDGKKCFFQDGEQVHYSDLWAAVKMMQDPEHTGQAKTLLQLCPDTFEGTFSHKFSRHQWKKKALSRN